MLKNYFTIALRNFRHNKIFSFINIIGLAIGISASLVIYLLANYHFTFDKFEKDGDRIYRVVSKFDFSGTKYYNSGVPDPLGNAVRKEITGIDAAIPFYTGDEAKFSILQAGKKEPVVYKDQKGIVYCDADLLDMLACQWLAGSPKAALLQPYQTVITEANATLYFPKLSPAEIIGKEIIMNDSVRATISGVVKGPEKNTVFSFKTFISRATLEKTSLRPADWEAWDNTNGNSQLFVKLSKGSTVAAIQKQIENLYIKNHRQNKDDHSTTEHSLQTLNDVHFNDQYGSYQIPGANKPTLYGLLAVAAFLLVLGCINFINLTTAQASQRAKEIGIRKTMGSTKKQLIVQFLIETFLLTLLATVLSVLLTPLILKAFSGFIPAALQFSILKQPGIIFFLLGLMLFVTLLAGFYPALILSGHKPVLLLKNQAYTNTSTSRSAWLRKTLTISQFVIAQVFIMATILVSKQINYSLNKNMGFKKDAIISFWTNYYDTVKNNKFVLMDKIRSIPGVSLVSLSTNAPTSNSTWSGTMKYKDGKKEVELDIHQKFGDTNYLKLYGIKLVSGRNLRASDTVREFIINETYSRALGFSNPDKAIGKYIDWSNKQIPIVGVVSDFNQQSLHAAIVPLVIASWDNTEKMVSVALQPQNTEGTLWKQTIQKIESSFKEIYPQDDFDYTFFDKDIAKYYQEEQNISGLLIWATGLAILISCLGLLGLVIYITNQRKKEIGIRKIIGASIVQIISLLSKDFLKLVLIAFIIALPIAWWGSYKWLESFAYRTSLSWWVFLSGGVIMLVIALATLLIKTFKAASDNPVKSLRTE